MPLSLVIYSEFFLSLPSIKKRDLICAHALVVETFEIISANLILWRVFLFEKSHFFKKVSISNLNLFLSVLQKVRFLTRPLGPPDLDICAWLINFLALFKFFHFFYIQ